MANHLQGARSMSVTRLKTSLEKAIGLINRTKAREALSILKQLAREKQYQPCQALHFYLGMAYEKTGQFPEAVESYKQAMLLDVNNGLPYHRIARLLAKDEQQILAIFYIKEAIKLIKDNHELYKDAACITSAIGLAEEAYEYCKHASELAPQDIVYFTSTIFFAHKLPSTTLGDLHELSKQYYQRFLAHIPSLDIDFSSKLNINKEKLKIGFVSADIHHHPLSTNLYQVFKKLNKERFDTYIYYSNDQDDAITEDIKSFVTNLKHIKRISDDKACELIIKDEIDILFDLSGFTRGERLPIFKRKPAPLQVSFLGYFGTLGMPEIDYIISDDTLVKPGEEEHFTEQVYKLPGCHMHSDLFGLKFEISELPYLRNGYITFGSMNNFHKISPQMIKDWAQILLAVKNSKLYFDNISMASECNKNYLAKEFAKHGIDTSRLILNASVFRQNFLESFTKIDIALDSTPYGGGTTTIETLSMGVPVITLYGNKWISRQASTFLKAIGHEELIANDMEDYINKAISLSTDIERLKNYRTNLGLEMQSKLNSNDYVRKFEAAIENMWQKKCS